MHSLETRGHRSRKRALELGAGSVGKHSRTSVIKCQYITLLVKKWAWGLISAYCFHELAVAAKMMLPPNHTVQELNDVCSCGSMGELPGNIPRDLTAMFCKDLLTPEPLTIRIPYVDPKGDKKHAESIETKIFLASDWIHCAHKLEAGKFIFGFQEVEAFWNNVAPTNKMLDPKITKRGAWKSKTLPLQLHADGAAFHDRDSLVTVSISGLLKQGSIKESNLVLASYPKSCTSKIQGSETWHVIWEWLVWDFHALLANKWPSVDPFGEPFAPGSIRAERAGKMILPSGWAAMIWNISGDMDYFQNDLGCPHHAVTGDKPLCIFCNCDKETRNWFDFRDASPWVQGRSLWVPQHPLFDLQTFSVYNISYDVLHVMDLGVTSHAVANLLFNIIFVGASDLSVAWSAT